MYHTPYKYDRVHALQYTFISLGKREIVKMVEFTPTSVKNVFNLGFGDLLPNGEIDDMVNSNNGDIIKIFATIIHILQDFTEQNPSFEILFLGSTPQRTSLYNRMLKTYYQSFSEKFEITAAVRTKNGSTHVPFDPIGTNSYHSFLIKRI